MPTVRSRDGIPVRLTEERWLHIVGRRPEMVGQQEKVLETLSEPDMIQKGDFGEKLAVRRYAETPLGDKYLIVAYREVEADDGFVVTAYLARKSSARREIVWRRP